jgi:hypothetical protein
MASFGRDWKKEYEKCERQRKYAWGQIFQAREAIHSLRLEIYEEVNEVGGADFNEDHNETSAHLMNFIKKLYKDAKEKVECPICLDIIETDRLDTLKCGHNFHEDCLDTLKQTNKDKKCCECPLCRKKFYNNQYGN